MEQKKKTKSIKECTLFSGLSEGELSSVVDIAKVKKFSKGKTIFSQGDPADGFYTVSSGKVKIYKLAGDGRQHILHIVTKDGVFAEAAVFAGSTFPAYAETLADSTLFYFPKDEFYALIKKNPQISLNMLATVSKYLRRFSSQIEQISLKDVSSRLAQYILTQSLDFGGNSFELKVKKGELAAQLGTVSETLSRSLNKLKSKKVIDVKGRYIYILDKDSLIAISKGMKL
jgi:CRP/FNR family transcriptional regulator